MATVRLNQGEVRRLLGTPSGPVGAEMARIGRLLRDEAQIQAPRGRSHRSRLKRSIELRGPIGSGAAMFIEVGSSLPYAKAVHDGRPAMTIRPVEKKALWWRGIQTRVDSRPSRGPYAGTGIPIMPPGRSVRSPAREANPFLTRALRIVAARLR